MSKGTLQLKAILICQAEPPLFLTKIRSSKFRINVHNIRTASLDNIWMVLLWEATLA